MFIKKQNGLSLIELLIGLLVGAIVVAGAVNIFTGSIQSSADNIKLTRLNQDLRAVMDIMVRDIRRAGFVTNNPAQFGQSLRNNPFFSIDDDTDISVLDYDSGSDNCILYSYNRDPTLHYDYDEAPPAPLDPIVPQTNDLLGFRLRLTGINAGVLQMRRSGLTTTDCSDGSWEGLTDRRDIEITNLTFAIDEQALNASVMSTRLKDGDPTTDLCSPGDATCTTCNTGDACVFVRWVDISLTGRLRDDPVVTQTLNQRIRIRNDKFMASFP
ncbi:prepilin-type N-terminal cleavage/methylation domain-containing protein [Methylotuvimicrobium sp. KM2]|uniref:PilW family protein n=1 Tax=Methylotuvimicrobium sp. KM2 TaxID=3133976 RepID=UPI00310117BF